VSRPQAVPEQASNLVMMMELGGAEWHNFRQSILIDLSLIPPGDPRVLDHRHNLFSSLRMICVDQALMTVN